METMNRPDPSGMDWVAATRTQRTEEEKTEDCRLANYWDCGSKQPLPKFAPISQSGTSETDNTCSSSSDEERDASGRRPPHSTAKADIKPQQQPPQEIRPYDVLISGHHRYRTDANRLYDNVVCPERSHDLNVQQVKADIKDALLENLGYNNDIPLPTFWIPSSKVENEQKNAWKGKSGTKRTLLVGDNIKLDVYEASDEWIVEENRGNSNRSPNKGLKRKIGGTNERAAVAPAFHSAAASLSSSATGEDSPQPKQLPAEKCGFDGKHASDVQNGHEDMSNSQRVEMDEDLAISMLLCEPGELDGMCRFEGSQTQPNATLEGIILQKIADGDEWAGSNMIRRACFVGFEDDVRKIREWNLAKEVYTNWNDGIRAQHFMQLEMRFTVLVKDLYEDMETRACIQESQETLSHLDDDSDNSPNEGDTEDADPRDDTTTSQDQRPHSSEANSEISHQPHDGGNFGSCSDQGTQKALDSPICMEEERGFTTHLPRFKEQIRSKDLPRSETEPCDAETPFDSQFGNDSDKPFVEVEPVEGSSDNRTREFEPVSNRSVFRRLTRWTKKFRKKSREPSMPKMMRNPETTSASRPEREPELFSKAKNSITQDQPDLLPHSAVTAMQWVDPTGLKGSYTGHIDSCGQPHGTGEIEYKVSGNTYSGGWKHGLKHGCGTYYWKNGCKYSGKWCDDERNGHGVLTFLTGESYYCWETATTLSVPTLGDGDPIQQGSDSRSDSNQQREPIIAWPVTSAVGSSDNFLTEANGWPVTSAVGSEKNLQEAKRATCKVIGSDPVFKDQCRPANGPAFRQQCRQLDP